MVSLYTVDCLRRLGIEIVLPIVLQKINTGNLKSKLNKIKEKTGEKHNYERALKDQTLDEYEQFDDYLEMVIEFGYLTMFASAFPLGSFVQIIYNIIEMKSDAFKLCFVVKRPPVIRENGIGSWQTVLEVQTWISIFTNILMFTFSSEQMETWFPNLFISDTQNLQYEVMLLF